MRSFGLDANFGDLALLLDLSASAGDHGLRCPTSFGDCHSFLVEHLLPARFLALEDGKPGLANLLFVFRGFAVCGGDIGAGFFGGSNGLAAAFGESANQGVMDNYAIQNPYENKEDDGRNGSERKFA